MVYDYKLHLAIRTPRACPWEQSVNDVYVHFCDDFKVTDDVISHMLGKKDDEFFPYHGASGGNILVQWKCPDGYAFGEYRLLDCRDDGIRKKAEEVYDEYKSWAGV